MIVWEDVHHAFGDRPVLRGVTATVGEARVGLVGANGSGKSTLARTVNGLVVPDRGRVVVEGLDVRRSGPAVRRRVGFAFTDPDAQVVMPTPAEDVAFSLRRSGLTRAEVAERVAAELARAGLSEHADAPAHLLSGGQKQLLALAAVLVTEPSVLVLDEPTTLLDLRHARETTRLLAGLPQQVLLVTHHLDLLAGADRVLVLHEGELVADDEPAPALAAYRALMDG